MPNRAIELHLWSPSFAGFGGGISAFSRELAGALAEAVPTCQLRLYGKSDVAGQWGQYPLNGVGAWPAHLRTTAFAAMVIAAGLSHRPTLVVSTHLNFGPAAGIIRAGLGVPYVLVAHGVDVHAGLSRWHLASLQQADGVWAVSRWTRQRLLNIGVDASRIQVIPNTVSDIDFNLAPQDPALRARYHLHPDEKVVLTVARLERSEDYKGYDKVLRALPAVCEAIGKVRYLLVGKGSGAQHLKRLAAELRISDHLTLCGFIPDAELAAHYRLADVFAMPSLGEGFGIVFLEALACGVPVVAGNRDGSTDALADGELGRLVNPEDINGIAAALIDLLRKRGPPLWFEPLALRKACLSRYGRGPFRARVKYALTSIAFPGGDYEE